MKEDRSRSGRGALLAFGDSDALHIQMPHEDALVVEVRINYFRVRRVLIDSGILADIIFLKAFKQLGIGSGALQPASAPWANFNERATESLRKVTLPVTLGVNPRTLDVTVVFLVADVPFAYNAILGRPTLNAISRYFYLPHEIEVSNPEGSWGSMGRPKGFEGMLSSLSKANGQGAIQESFTWNCPTPTPR